MMFPRDCTHKCRNYSTDENKQLGTCICRCEILNCDVSATEMDTLMVACPIAQMKEKKQWPKL